ncbi:MAG TPA: type II secretion system F family protein [Verrucomicrobiae bacterium]|jgi:type IV pilus assembly protein PilC|nr:type II secretion system F family protein [Verrucomicrobiae bacterium]
MPLIVTPSELRRRADFYHQLQQLTAAGLGIVRSVDQLKRNAPSRAYRAKTEELARHLERGQPFGESLRAISNWLPELDVTLIEAGEKSGRLDRCFRMLGDYYAERAKIAKRVIGGLAYPAFLVHLLAAVMALVFFFWKPAWCLAPIAGLGALYVLVFLLVYATQNKHGEAWRAKVEFIFNLVPVLGKARRHLALGRLAAALEALISAGVSIIEAWELAARASGSVALQRMVESWNPELRAGKTPAEMIERSRRFPEIFASQYAAGEVSGKLDETLERLRDYYQEDGSQKAQLLAQWVPIGIYLLVLIGGGAFVIWFWTSYFSKIQQAIDF